MGLRGIAMSIILVIKYFILYFMKDEQIIQNINSELLMTISKLKVYDVSGNLLSFKDSNSIKRHIRRFSLVKKDDNIFCKLHHEDLWALFEKHCKYEVIAEIFEGNFDETKNKDSLDYLAMIYFKEKPNKFEPIKNLHEKIYKVYGVRGTTLFGYDKKIKTDIKIIIVRNKN